MTRSTRLVEVEVERVRTDTTIIQVPIDEQDFEEWSGSADYNPSTVIDYITADLNWQETFWPMLRGVRWGDRYRDEEWKLRVPLGGD